MIDASDITDYQPSQWKLESSAIFWVLAAGKNGTRAADITNKLVSSVTPSGINPLGALSLQGREAITYILKEHGSGCHNQKARTLDELSKAGLDLRTCSPQDMEKIYGIGRKTSRCFILHSRKNARVAGLDTHVLKFLDLMGVEDVPKTTPSSEKQYSRLENEFLKLADKYNMSPAELDLLVWNEYSIR